MVVQGYGEFDPYANTRISPINKIKNSSRKFCSRQCGSGKLIDNGGNGTLWIRGAFRNSGSSIRAKLLPQKLWNNNTTSVTTTDPSPSQSCPSKQPLSAEWRKPTDSCDTSSQIGDYFKVLSQKGCVSHYPIYSDFIFSFF